MDSASLVEYRFQHFFPVFAEFRTHCGRLDRTACWNQSPPQTTVIASSNLKMDHDSKTSHVEAAISFSNGLEITVFEYVHQKDKTGRPLKATPVDRTKQYQIGTDDRLSTLSVELLLHVFGHLPTPSIALMQRSNRLLHAVVVRHFDHIVKPRVNRTTARLYADQVPEQNYFGLRLDDALRSHVRYAGYPLQWSMENFCLDVANKFTADNDLAAFIPNIRYLPRLVEAVLSYDRELHRPETGILCCWSCFLCVGDNNGSDSYLQRNTGYIQSYAERSVSASSRNALLSLNEIPADPTRFSVSRASFDSMLDRVEVDPLVGEEVRARPCTSREHRYLCKILDDGDFARYTGITGLEREFDYSLTAEGKRLVLDCWPAADRYSETGNRLLAVAIGEEVGIVLAQTMMI